MDPAIEQQQQQKLEPQVDDETSIKTVFSYQIKNLESLQKNLVEDKTEILSAEEKAIANDIIIEYKKNVEDFTQFLDMSYMKFDYKINKCQLTHCLNDIFKDRDTMRSCRQKCHVGIAKADQFVERQVDQFYDKFNTCIQSAQKSKKDIMKESFLCYDKMLKSFYPMKKAIHQEFNYYQ